MKESLVKVIVHQLKIDEIFQFHFSYRVVFDGGHCRCRRRKVPGVNVVKLYFRHHWQPIEPSYIILKFFKAGVEFARLPI